MPMQFFLNQQSHIPNAGWTLLASNQLWQIADDIKNNLDEAKLLQALPKGSHLEHGETTEPEKPKQPIVWGYCWWWWLEPVGNQWKHEEKRCCVSFLK